MHLAFNVTYLYGLPHCNSSTIYMQCINFKYQTHVLIQSTSFSLLLIHLCYSECPSHS